MLKEPKLSEKKEPIETNSSGGEVDKYTWVDIGSSYLPSDLLAAYLYAQLEQYEFIQEKRKTLWHYYDGALKDWAGGCGVSLPIIPEHCDQAYHMFYLILPSLEKRQSLIKHLKNFGILSVFHYLPLHLSNMGVTFGGKQGDCPVSEKISDGILRLPFYNDLTEKDQEYVVKIVKDWKF